MKRLTFLISLVFINLFPALSAGNELVGKWKNTDMLCEDGRLLSKEFKKKAEEFISKTQTTYHFQKNGIFLTRHRVQNKTSNSLCSIEFSLSYSVSEDQKTIYRELLDLSAYPVVVDCGGNKELERSYQRKFTDRFSQIRKMGLHKSENEIQIKKDKMFFFQPLKKRHTDFDCGPKTRVIEVWEPI